MKTVGVRELKNRLSYYLRIVQSGEVVRVTARDKVVAEIHKSKLSKAARDDRLHKWLVAQERAGHLRRATRAAPAWQQITALPRLIPPADLQMLLDETRAERV